MSLPISGDVGAQEIDITNETSSQHHSEAPYIHKVGIPPKQNLLQEITATVKETLFADDLFRQFKDQPRSRKFIIGIQSVFPILEWGRHYNLTKFRGDLIAGLTVASLCIPQGIAYAKVANLDPQYGLYSSSVPPLIYAFMGSSRDMAIGPVAVVSLLLGALLGEEIDPDIHPLDYRRLAFTATFFAGITEVVLGFFRLGFLIDFLSHAAVVGFMAGAAITISLQQFKGLLGITKFTKKTDIVSVMRSVWSTVNHGWNWQTIVIAVTFLAFLLLAKYIGKKNRKLFWVPAIAPLISIILSTFLVYITRADKHDVAIVGKVKKGVNPSSVNEIFFTGTYLAKGFEIGVVAGLVALAEAIAIGRTFATKNNYQLDGNKEMIAQGTMNVVGSMTSCFITTGSFSRSAVNCMTGCQTTVSNMVMSCVVLLTLELITPLFKYTPNAILASIVISATVGLIDIEAILLFWKIDKFDFATCTGACLGVVFVSVEIGLLIAVSISFAKILLQVTRPRTSILGKLPRTTNYGDILQYPEAKKVPGVLIVRVDSAIYFSNSNYIRERIWRWLGDEEEYLKENHQPRIQYLILEMSPVTNIDTSGIQALEELHKSLQKGNIQLVLANPGPVVIHKLHASKFTDLIGEDKIFVTVSDAIVTYKIGEA
ncbi:sulfate transporter 1.3 [Eucalyptus grandis]|uniref:Uncharacterized protein n=2 Tax=Eucalyptus grandis TaxID=71139 RepID=A0ACC3JKE1_EUCGR|nr:sulfate transporter 1.3 [Eucalyptus grandis]KAK3414180.1 hypothetical protein EUGRSUZ_I02682 [Eucalyptus grandis]